VFAFLAPDNPARCIVILDTNPFATGSEFHPDAVYRINVDNDDDALTDVAISAVFSSPTGGQQTATVYLTTGEQAKQPEALGEAIIEVLPDILRFDRSKAAAYPNGRTLTDDVFDARLALVSNGKIPGDNIGTHTDLLADFPYLETPPSHGAARALTPGPSRRSSRLWLVSGVRRRPSGWPHSRPERFRDQRSGLTGSLPTSTLRDKHATCSAT
jgi:hypothetical protein